MNKKKSRLERPDELPGLVHQEFFVERDKRLLLEHPELDTLVLEDSNDFKFDHLSASPELTFVSLGYVAPGSQMNCAVVGRAHSDLLEVDAESEDLRVLDLCSLDMAIALQKAGLSGLERPYADKGLIILTKGGYTNKGKGPFTWYVYLKETEPGSGQFEVRTICEHWSFWIREDNGWDVVLPCVRSTDCFLRNHIPKK
ncbi:MAG: hypothetical protein WCG97_03305 [bacterium]